MTIITCAVTGVTAVALVVLGLCRAASIDADTYEDYMNTQRAVTDGSN